MKKIISVLIAFVIITTMLTVVPFTVSAAESGTTGDCTWTLDDKGVLTISGNGAMGGYNYDNPAPWGKDIKKVVIEKGVTNIGTEAFYACKILTDISIPNSVITIGSSAFGNCHQLTNPTLPDSIKVIGDSAFSNCYKLSDVTIPKSVISIKSNTFYNCTSLSNVTISNTVTSIDMLAFYHCTKLFNVTIPDSVETIGAYAFGYYGNHDKVEGFTIYGVKGSAAETYANDNVFKFIDIESKTIIGDVNGDKYIDVLDAIVVQKYSVDKEELTEEQLIAADVNGDNNVDVLDAADIQKYAAEKITEFKKKA